MNTAVVVALITSIASLVAATLSAVWAARLQRQRATEERLAGSKAELDRYREPLLSAANELGDRIDNIRNREFLFYLCFGPDHLREPALLSTLFRFGQYFARLEMLYTNLSLMHFAKDEDTKIVAGFIRDISRTFATDALKPAVLSPTERYICFNRFMVWREEQRGIGEMMCVGHDGKPASCAGYASFVNQYEERYSKWFTAIANDLQSFAKDRQSKAVDDSERLRQLQSLLAKLVTQLDEEKAYMRLNDMGKPEEPRWIARAEEPSRRSKDRLAKINITP